MVLTVRNAGILATGLALRCISFHWRHLIPWAGGTVPIDCPCATSIFSILLSLFKPGFLDASHIFTALSLLAQLGTFFLLLSLCQRGAISDNNNNTSCHRPIVNESSLNIEHSVVSHVSESKQQPTLMSTTCGSSDWMQSGCGPAVFYWLCPVSVLASTLSPLPALHHTGLLAAIAAATKEYTADDERSVVSSAALLCLVLSLLWLDPEVLPLILLLFLILTCIDCSKGGSNSLTLSRSLAMLVLCCAGCVCVVVWSERGSLLVEVLRRYSVTGGGEGAQEYFPGYGVLWYLKAQVFPRYSRFFVLLPACQPLLYILPLHIRLARSGMPLAAALVMLAVVSLCRPDSSFSDQALVVCCFCSQNLVLARMRHLPLLLPLSLVSSLGGPLMLHLWVVSGTGNANFVFFLGLGASLAAIVTIVEFTRAAMSIRNGRNCKTK